ncbi:MAG: hypothetical protein VYC17_04395 [Nitrospinota bacterium]|nr:hypothetical protein [Nitrospinota bacterium]
MQEQDPSVAENGQNKTPQNEPEGKAHSEDLPVEKEIDLKTVFPDEDIDLNTLFPDMEMKRFLKKIKRNKRDLQEMTGGFDEAVEMVDP